MEIKIPSIVRIKSGAVRKIGKYLNNLNYKNIALIWGIGVNKLFESDVKASLNDYNINILYENVLDSNSIDDIINYGAEIDNKTEVIVAIGGGKVIDISKYLAYILNLSFFSVPTVLSNDGFGSSVASLYYKGKRKTMKAKIPDGIIIDLDIVSRAPVKFIYAGMGDLISKITAVRDWKLAYYNQGVSVNDFSVVVSLDAIDGFIYYPDKNINNLEFIKTIASGLLISGSAMEIAGSSRPASGSEHLISHAYDIVSKNPSMHGLQVGVATYGISYIQNNNFELVKKTLIDCGFINFMKNNKLNKEDFIKAIEMAPTIKNNYYTVLSNKENIQKLIDFVNNDEIYREVLG